MEEWINSLTQYMDNQFGSDLANLKELVDTEVEEFKVLSKTVFDMKSKFKEIGLMRMAWLMDFMYKAVNEFNIQTQV